MLHEFPSASLVDGLGVRFPGRSVVWLPTDREDVARFCARESLPMPSLAANEPWAGIFVGVVADATSETGPGSAIGVTLGAHTYSVTAQASYDLPGIQGLVLGQSLIGSSVLGGGTPARWVVEFTGAGTFPGSVREESVPAADDAGSSKTSDSVTATEAVDVRRSYPDVDEQDQRLLSRVTATIAAGDPKAFEKVVDDVIRRMRAIEESDAPAVVKLHAGAAAGSLEVVRAAIAGEIRDDDADPGGSALATLCARLVALGMVAVFPQLGVVVQAAELILRYWHDRRESVSTTFVPRASEGRAVASIAVVESPALLPPQGMGAVTVQVSSGSGVPIEGVRINASVTGGRFAENHQGRWVFADRMWVADSSADGTARFNVAPAPGASKVALRFEGDGVVATIDVPVGMPA